MSLPPRSRSQHCIRSMIRVGLSQPRFTPCPSLLTPALPLGSRGCPRCKCVIAAPGIRPPIPGAMPPASSGWRRSSSASPGHCSRWSRSCPGEDPEDPDTDPILDAVELHESGQFFAARRLLLQIAERDPRCIDAHAHLGHFAFDQDLEQRHSPTSPRGWNSAAGRSASSSMACSPGTCSTIDPIFDACTGMDCVSGGSSASRTRRAFSRSCSGSTPRIIRALDLT